MEGRDILTLDCALALIDVMRAAQGNRDVRRASRIEDNAWSQAQATHLCDENGKIVDRQADIRDAFLAVWLPGESGPQFWAIRELIEDHINNRFFVVLG